MTRLTDECLEAARLNHAMLTKVIGEPPGVLDALRANPGSAWKAHLDRGDLLAEVDRARAFEVENDELWADLTRVQGEVELLRSRPGAAPVVAAPLGPEVVCRECGGLGFHRVGNTDRTVYCSCSSWKGGAS